MANGPATFIFNNGSSRVPDCIVLTGDFDLTDDRIASDFELIPLDTNSVADQTQLQQIQRLAELTDNNVIGVRWADGTAAMLMFDQSSARPSRTQLLRAYKASFAARCAQVGQDQYARGSAGMTPAIIGVQEAALVYLRAGFQPVPLRPRTKCQFAAYWSQRFAA